MIKTILGKTLCKTGNLIDTIGFRLIMIFDTGILCNVGNRLMEFATKIQTIGCKLWWFNEFMSERQGY